MTAVALLIGDVHHALSAIGVPTPNGHDLADQHSAYMNDLQACFDVTCFK